MRGRKLLFNTLLLTAASLLIRAIGLWFQAFLTAKLGAAGMGLFQLVMSVQVLAVTFAVSGVRFAVTRLVAEELGLGKPDGVRSAVRRCLCYAAVCGTLAGAVLYGFADHIGGVWVGDARTILSIRILGLSMPLIALASVPGGYFTAVQRVVKSAAVQIFEQVVRIAAVMLLFAAAPAGDLEHACASVALGNVLGQLLALLLLFLLYRLDVRRYPAGGKRPGQGRRLLQIAVPLALSSYARTALGTLQHLLVPRGLRRAGASVEASLAAYGTISGMALPLLLFPHAICTALSEMLIPNVTEAQMAGDRRQVDRLARRALQLNLLFAVGAAGVFFAFAGELGLLMYRSAEAGRYIRIFAPLVVVMYMDTVTDGVLKGLGQQLDSMKYNVLDALLSVLLVWTLLPRLGVPAYVFTIFFTESFNFVLSFRRLGMLTDTGMGLAALLRPLFCVVGAANLAVLLLRLLGLPLAATAGSLVLHILLSAGLYVLLLRLLGAGDSLFSKRGNCGILT